MLSGFIPLGWDGFICGRLTQTYIKVYLRSEPLENGELQGLRC